MTIKDIGVLVNCIPASFTDDKGKVVNYGDVSFLTSDNQLIKPKCTYELAGQYAKLSGKKVEITLGVVAGFKQVATVRFISAEEIK